MGASGGGIIIRTAKSKEVDTIDLINAITGKEFEKSKYCDSRNKGCFYVGKTANSISILNSDLADTFFKAKDTSVLSSILNVLPENDFIYAFEEYDSGGTYGYATIRKNKFNRKFRSLSYEVEIDEGELEDREIAWNNAKKEKDDLGDGEWEWLYTHPDRDDFKCSEANLPQIKLQDIMIHNFSLTTESMADNFNEQGHYQEIKLVQAVVDNKETISNKPWWKFW